MNVSVRWVGLVPGLLVGRDLLRYGVHATRRRRQSPMLRRRGVDAVLLGLCVSRRVAAAWRRPPGGQVVPELFEDGAGESGRNASMESLEAGPGPVNIHRSLTRERLEREMDVSRENACVSSEESSERMWRKESVAKVSSWNPGHRLDNSLFTMRDSAHICTLLA